MNICCPKRDTISNGPISCVVDETVSAAAADRSGRWRRDGRDVDEGEVATGVGIRHQSFSLNFSVERSPSSV